jgi:hypothetical protein
MAAPDFQVNAIYRDETTELLDETASLENAVFCHQALFAFLSGRRQSAPLPLLSMIMRWAPGLRKRATSKIGTDAERDVFLISLLR